MAAAVDSEPHHYDRPDLIVFFAIGRLMLQKAEHEAQTYPT